MSKIISQDKIFLEKEGDDFFERNGPSVNQAIYKAIKFLRPKKNIEMARNFCQARGYGRNFCQVGAALYVPKS